MNLNVTTLYNKFFSLYNSVPYNFLNGYSFPPLQIHFHLTHRCNFRCEFCFYFKDDNDIDQKKLKDQELATSEIKRIVREMPKRGLMTFTGGEPFVRPDCVEIISDASKLRRTHVISNGYAITPEDVPSLIKAGATHIFSKGFVLFGISFQGLSKTHADITGVPGGFEKSLEAFKRLAEEKKRQNKRYPLLNFKTVISEKTYKELPELYRVAQDAGANMFNILAEFTTRFSQDAPNKDFDHFSKEVDPLPELDVNLLKEIIDELKSMSKHTDVQLRITPTQLPLDYIFAHYSGNDDLTKYYCRSPWSKIEISPYGDVYPCLEMNMGNLRDQSFKEIWNSNKMKKFRRALKEKSIFPACLGCCNMELKSPER